MFLLWTPWTSARNVGEAKHPGPGSVKVLSINVTSLGANIDDIKAFALLDEVDAPDLGSLVDPDIPTTGNFSQNADEMV